MTVPRSVRRRASLAVALVAVIVAVFVVRLIDIQVVNADALNAESFDKRSVQRSVMGLRGDILDSSGAILASTVLRYTVTAAPKVVGEFTRTVDGKNVQVSAQTAAGEIAKILGQSPEQVWTALTADPSSNYAVLAKGVNVDTFRAIDALDIPWVYFESQQARTYPNGSVAGNLIGFTGADGTAQAGLEAQYDSCLRGQDGLQLSEQGADGVTIPGSTVAAKAAQNGAAVVTTIDKDLQWQVQQIVAERVQKVQAEWGMAIVVEAKTGRILAAGEYPSVDPGNVDATPADARGARVFQAPVEPGSTFKSITAAVLLDTGTATPMTHMESPTRFTFGDGSIVVDSGGHPTNLTLTGIIRESSNVGISKLADQMGVSQRYDYLKAFGFGSLTAVGFPGEEEGTIRTPEQWDDQTVHNTAFGQGLSVTPLQLAGAYQALANNGTKLPLRLVDGCRSPDGTMTQVPKEAATQVVSSGTAQQTVNMMETVVTDGYAKKYLQIPGYRVAAKTGTAELSNGSGAYGGLYYTSVAGMAPAENPQYVVYAGMYKAAGTMGDSALAAAPVFQDVLSHVLKKYRVLPSTEPAPNFPATY